MSGFGTVSCSTCGYGFDPGDGLDCPRCGSSFDCTSLSCDDCGACPTIEAGIGAALRFARRD